MKESKITQKLERVIREIVKRELSNMLNEAPNTNWSSRMQRGDDKVDADDATGMTVPQGFLLIVKAAKNELPEIEIMAFDTKQSAGKFYVLNRQDFGNDQVVTLNQAGLKDVLEPAPNLIHRVMKYFMTAQGGEGIYPVYGSWMDSWDDDVEPYRLSPTRPLEQRQIQKIMPGLISKLRRPVQ